LHKLLTCGIDKHGQLRVASDYNETSLELDIKRFPTEWKIRPLGIVAEIRSGITLNKKLSNTDAIALPYLRVANVQDGYLDLSEILTFRLIRP
jgi:type I restriction enzyme, S subunit